MPIMAPIANPSAQPLVGWDEPERTRSRRSNMWAAIDATRQMNSKLIGLTIGAC